MVELTGIYVNEQPPYDADGYFLHKDGMNEPFISEEEQNVLFRKLLINRINFLVIGTSVYIL